MKELAAQACNLEETKLSSSDLHLHTMVSMLRSMLPWQTFLLAVLPAPRGLEMKETGRHRGISENRNPHFFVVIYDFLLLGWIPESPAGQKVKF